MKTYWILSAGALVLSACGSVPGFGDSVPAQEDELILKPADLRALAEQTIKAR